MLRFELQNDSKLITFFKKIQYLGLLFFKCSFVKLLKVILSFFFRCFTLRLLLMSQKYLTSVVKIKQELRLLLYIMIFKGGT